MKSIIPDDRKDRCYICGSPWAIEEHHIFGGISKRNISEKYGLKVHLCYECHQGTRGAHGKEGKEIQSMLHEIGQQACEEYLKAQGKEDPRGEFIREFGKSYL